MVPKRTEPPSSVHFPTREEVALLGITAPSESDRVRLLIAAYCGLRPGEQTALQWRHYNADSGMLRIEQAMDLRGRIKSTKTGKSRSVPMPLSVIEAVERWRASTRFARPADPVICTITGQHVRDSNWRDRTYYEWRSEAGVGLQWRNLRHYYASELAASGATIMQCSRWMGHGSIRTTIDRYAALFDEDADRVMIRLG